MRQRAIQINFVTTEEVRNLLKTRGAEVGLTASGMAGLVIADWFERNGPAIAREPLIGHVPALARAQPVAGQDAAMTMSAANQRDAALSSA